MGHHCSRCFPAARWNDFCQRPFTRVSPAHMYLFRLHVNGWRRRHHMSYSAGERILPLATTKLAAFAYQPHNVPSNLSRTSEMNEELISVGHWLCVHCCWNTAPDLTMAKLRLERSRLVFDVVEQAKTVKPIRSYMSSSLNQAVAVSNPFLPAAV